MNHLQLPVLGEGLGVGGESGGVPAVVTGEFSGEVGWGRAGEWAQVQDTIGAVPWAAGGGGLPHADTSSAENVGGVVAELDRGAGQ